ncbi:2772_t:CDS:2 [Entrophospora sp. SA101]|nr:2772_t:CDS:2 [Entrophospora sp. SA101]
MDSVDMTGGDTTSVMVPNDYWNCNPNSWGSLSDWDIYYINHTSGSTKMKAHWSLGLELKVLLKRLSKTSHGYYKDCHNNPVNIELWQEHSTKLGRLAVENRINNHEILTVGIHAATIAVATEFPKEKTKEEKIQEKFWTVDDFDDNKENGYEPGDIDIESWYELDKHQDKDVDVNQEIMRKDQAGKVNDDTDEKIVTTSNTSLCNPTDDDEFTMQDKELFMQRFETMKNEKKWKLKTGIYVEDILYDLGKKSKFHNLIHSFIVDPEDKFLQSGFTTDELTEICETMTMQEAPQIKDELLEYIDTFAKTLS